MYSLQFKKRVKDLFTEGKSHKEICELTERSIPKSTLSTWVSGISLSQDVFERKKAQTLKRLEQARIASVIERQKRKELSNKRLEKSLSHITKDLLGSSGAKLALALLYWAEGAKNNNCCFANSDAEMVFVYVKLLRDFYDVPVSKFRFTVQCRADQDADLLERYWKEVVDMPGARFYTARIDKRTAGSPTKKVGYKGVLRVDCFDATIRRELEIIRNLICRKIIGGR